MSVYEIEVKLFPNPTTGAFTANYERGLQISAYDIFGRVVYQSTDLPVSQSITVDLGLYPKGVYFVRIKLDEEIISRKIILQ